MLEAWIILKKTGFCIYQSVLHPRTPIVLDNPGELSPIPWWGSIGILAMGIISWVISACLGVKGLDEAGRAMVYLPLGNIFNMSMGLRKK